MTDIIVCYYNGEDLVETHAHWTVNEDLVPGNIIVGGADVPFEVLRTETRGDRHTALVKSVR